MIFKKIIPLLILLFLYFSMNAQNNPQSQIDSAYMNLDTSFMSTKILHDKAVHFCNFNDFSGTSDTSIINIEKWKQLYLELYNGSYVRSTTETYTSIDKRAIDYMVANNNTVPLLILNFDYNIIKALALDSGLIVKHEKIMYDSLPRTECPYSIEKVFAATPYLKNMEQTIVTFYIGSEYYFSNNTDLPVTIEVDFGDGNGYRTVSFGNTITVTYPNTLEKNIITKITYSSSILKSSSSIAASLCSGPSFPAPGAIWNITATIPYDGQLGKANAYVLFHNPSIPYLRKPLVFVEGVDFGEAHYPQRNGDFGWCAFWGSQPDDYGDLTNMPSILNELHAKGYDIILLDFYDGADYIQRNSLVLVELLETIKSSPHPGTELQQTVVIGASMGGQVAKYALSYMEKNNIPTCTREYLSFDSPQKGANISLGVQYLLDFFGNSFPSPLNAKFNDLLDKQINRPAAKQLVNYHYSNPSYSGTNSPNDAATIHSQFYSEIGALGYPKKSRIVAIANGSRAQLSQGFNAGDKVFEWKWNPIGCGLINIITGDVWSVNNSNKIMTGNFPANTTAFGACLAISTAITIGGGSIATGAAACGACAVTGVGFSSSTVYGPPTGLPYDNCPGGYRPLFKDIEVELRKALAGSGLYLRDASLPEALHENQSFIPSISSLDINTSDLFFNISTITTFPNALTPFEDFYAPTGNQPHVYADNTPGGSAAFGYNAIPGGNLEWGLKEIFNSENRLMSPLSSTTSPNSGIFNYGRKESRFLSSLFISNFGKLYVNANRPTDYGAATPAPGVPSGTNPPVAGSTFILETCNCENVEVQVVTTGQMILGEASPNNKAIVYFHKGSKLILNTGSKLIINNNSRLVIEEGAELFFQPGAMIELLGDNAVLEIKGDLKLGAGAVFTFTYPGTTSGYVKFSRDTPWDNLPHITGFTGCSIELTGANKNDKILEVAQDILFISQFENISLFKIQTGTVEFTNPATQYISVDAPTRFIASRFISNSVNDAVAVWGQPVCQITNCLFDRVAVAGMLFMYGNKLSMSYTEIKNCNTAGLGTQGMGVNLFNTNFNSNESGMNSQLMTQNSTVTGAKFMNNNFGASMWASPVEITFTTCKIKNNSAYGIDVVGPTKAKVKCGEVSKNFTGFYISATGSLSMNTTLGGGYVDAQDNEENTILLDYANSVDINNGYNDLRVKTGGGATYSSAIYGALTCLNYGDCPVEIAGTLKVLPGIPVIANNNKWQPPISPSGIPTYRPLVTITLEDKFTEVFSTYAPTTRLHFTDVAQSGMVPCGFWDPAPCIGCPASFLEVCPTCNTINTTDFVNKKSNVAVKEALSKMDSTVINGYKHAVDLFHQVLKYSMPTPTDGDKYVKNIAEREIVVSLMQSIENNQVAVSDSTIAPEVSKALDIQDDKIAQAIIDDKYLDKLYGYIEKALINYAAKRRVEALSILDNVLTFVQPNEFDYVTYIKCLISNEHLLMTKQMDQIEFLNAVSLCIQPNRNIVRSMSFISNDETEEEEDKYSISVYPNPASNQLFLEYDLSEVSEARFIIYDIAGKVLYQNTLKGGKRVEEIAGLNLANGVYMYRIVSSDDSILKQSKLTIIK